MTERFGWDRLRPWPVYMLAAAVPLSVAAVSVSKALMFLFGLVALGVGLAHRERLPQLRAFRTPLMIVAMLAALAMSLAYTTAPIDLALSDLGKYGKLLEIPLVLLLVRTRREALTALAVYGVAQVFVVFSSYLLTLDLVLPWVPKDAAHRLSIGTVFSSYLDQSIMTAGLAALCWNLRDELPWRQGRLLAIGIAVVAAINVLFLLPGRTGQAGLLAALALALFWYLPRRARPAAIVAPLLLVVAAMAVSTPFRERLTAVVSESQAYRPGDLQLTSSGIRLNLWQRSVEMIREHPLAGSGVGSWNAEYRRLEGERISPHLVVVRNPHQEYLLWGAQLGLGGIALLLAFFAVLARDASPFRRDVRHATQSMVAILAVVCFFNASIFDALIGDYFCVLIGVLLVLGAHTPPEGKPA
ncbi:MAG: O-antigen ligase family protein [Pseudomonadota bacterium]